VTRFQRNGWPTVTPRLITPEVGQVVGFLKSVFDAAGEMRIGAPAEMRIGDSMIMVSDGGSVRDPLPTFLHVYVENTDRTFRRAIAAGAVAIEAPMDMPYGDRRATVRDPWETFGRSQHMAVRRLDGPERRKRPPPGAESGARP
jgi:uncharacterized glyoxalase superfamily protein PhnB